MHNPTALFLNTTLGRIAGDFNRLLKHSCDVCGALCPHTRDQELGIGMFVGQTLPALLHIHLALLHSVAEEGVQQQVLQIAVPVERLLDLSQEDAVGAGDGDKPGHFDCTVAERE